VLAAEGIVKRFGQVTVLHDVSVQAGFGSITGLIGPNGSGKSTLFDVVTGIVSKDGGTVSLNGTSLDGLKPHELARRSVIRTFQVPRVARRMTVLENLMVVPPSGEGESVLRLFSPLHVRRVRRDERKRLDQARSMLAELGLERLADDYADVLSGGQLKLLSIGIALMGDPQTLLLDEPTAGVNPVLIERILALLAARCGAGKTTLVIEHNIPVISEICDTVFVLHAGRIIAAGVPDQVRNDERVIDAYLGRREHDRKLV
jgi:ABC-type branched-subunit amino acid transport system ATPase component